MDKHDQAIFIDALTAKINELLKREAARDGRQYLAEHLEISAYDKTGSIIFLTITDNLVITYYEYLAKGKDHG